MPTVNEPIRISLFGAPGVIAANNSVTPLRHSKGVGVLAYLLLESEQPHARSVIASMLWGDSDQSRARRSLSQALKRLNGEIAEAAPSSSSPVIGGNRTVLQVAIYDATSDGDSGAKRAIDCDAVRFDQLLRQTNAHKHSSLRRCTHCHLLLREAVALVKGQLLSGLDAHNGADQFEEWLLLKRESIHEHLMAALALLADAALVDGAYDDAASFARQQLAAEPWRESAYRQLIKALIGNNDVVGAMMQYATCKEVLRDELAVEPSEETMLLVQQLGAKGVPADSALGLAKADIFESAAESTHAVVPTSNLPSALVPMFGREKELEHLLEKVLSPQSRIITVLGPGGIGKTTLALETGRDLLGLENNGLDGIYFVPLVGVDSAEMVPDAIAKAVGLTVTASDTSADIVSAFFADKLALLILDNFEHLPDATEWLIELLERAAQLQLLITSREQLGLMSEEIYHVDGLPVPPLEAEMAQANRFAATSLFIDRAKRQHPQFWLSAENWPSIRAVCRQLGGHPLGIELTTTLLADMTLPEIVTSVTETVDYLETDLKDIAPHHRSMRTVFEQSWSRIGVQEQQVIAGLSVMRGSFSSTAARAVTDATPLNLRRLRHKSFLRSAAPGRYDMHELVRQFSAEKLAQNADNVEQSERRLASYFLGRIADSTDHLDQADGIPYIEAFERNLDAIRRAWQYAIAHADLAIIRNALLGMGQFMQHVGRYRELVELCDSVDQMVSRQPDSPDGAWITAGTQTLTASIHCLTNNGALSDEIAAGALQAAESLNSAEMIAKNRLTLLDNLLTNGDHQAVSEQVNDLIEFCHKHTLWSLQSKALFEAGFSAYFISNYDRAERYFQAVLDLFEETARGISQSSRSVAYLGIIKLDEADYESARVDLLVSLKRAELTQDRRWSSFSRHFLGLMYTLLGQYESAIEVETLALDTMREIGDIDAQSFMLHTLACAQRNLGLIEQARASANQAFAFSKESGALLAHSYALDQCSELAALDGDWTRAMSYIREAAQLMAQTGRERESRLFQFIEARFALDSGDGVGSAELLEPLLQYLPKENTPYRDSLVFAPLRAFAMADRILVDSADTRREYYFSIGQSYLTKVADKIKDPQLRHDFLTRDPDNCYLTDACNLVHT